MGQFGFRRGWACGKLGGGRPGGQRRSRHRARPPARAAFCRNSRGRRGGHRAIESAADSGQEFCLDRGNFPVAPGHGGQRRDEALAVKGHGKRQGFQRPVERFGAHLGKRQEIQAIDRRMRRATRKGGGNGGRIAAARVRHQREQERAVARQRAGDREQGRRHGRHERIAQEAQQQVFGNRHAPVGVRQCLARGEQDLACAARQLAQTAERKLDERQAQAGGEIGRHGGDFPGEGGIVTPRQEFELGRALLRVARKQQGEHGGARAGGRCHCRAQNLRQGFDDLLGGCQRCGGRGADGCGERLRGGRGDKRWLGCRRRWGGGEAGDRAFRKGRRDGNLRGGNGRSAAFDAADALGQRRVGGEPAGEALAGIEKHVADCFRLRAGQRCAVLGDLAQRAGNPGRISRELHRRGIGEKLPLARHRRANQPAGKHADVAGDHQRQAQRDEAAAVLVGATAAASQEHPSRRGEHEEPVQHADEPQVQPHVAIQDMAEFVGHHPLQLLAGEFLQRAPGHGDDGFPRSRAGGEGVDARFMVEHIDRRRGNAGGHRHLVGEVDEPPLGGIGRRARHESPAQRCSHRGAATCGEFRDFPCRTAEDRTADAQRDQDEQAGLPQRATLSGQRHGHGQIDDPHAPQDRQQKPQHQPAARPARPVLRGKEVHAARRSVT